MNPYREHQIARPEPCRARATRFIADALDAVWPYALAASFVVGGTYGMVFAIDAGEAASAKRRTSLATEARLWASSVGFQVVGVYCYGDAVCDVSVGSAESMRVLYLHCVPSEGCVPR